MQQTPSNIYQGPPLNSQAQTLLQNIQHSTSYPDLQRSTKNFLTYLLHQYHLEQAIVKVNLKQPYQFQIHPTFKRSEGEVAFTNKLFHRFRWYHVGNTFKEVMNEFAWKPYSRELQWKLRLFNYDDWASEIMIKNNKPLAENWRTNVRTFSLYKKMKKGSHQNSYWYITTKQYQNYPIQQYKQIYKESNLLKNTDTYQVGLKSNSYHQNMKSRKKLAIGTNFEGFRYFRMKAHYQDKIYQAPGYQINLFSDFGLLYGRSLLENEMFIRNKKKWMNERSQVFFHSKAELQIKSVENIFNFLSVVPYVEGTASINKHQQTKLEGEYGITFKIKKKNLFDLCLFQVANTWRDGKFIGLRYQF